MPMEIVMPKLGFSMTEGDLVEWFVADGGAVTEGEKLYAIESEKSTQEIDAPASGVLEILKATGSTYEVGTILGRIA